MTAEITIRPATTADCPAICAVHVRSILTCCAEHYPPDAVDAWTAQKQPSAYAGQISDPDWCVVVAERDGLILGFGQLLLKNGVIAGLYLEPDAIGQGLGGRLFDTLLDAARARGLEQLTLHATKNAEDFYRSRGFTPGELEPFHFNDTVGIAARRMTMELGSTSTSK